MLSGEDYGGLEKLSGVVGGEQLWVQTQNVQDREAVVYDEGGRGHPRERGDLERQRSRQPRRDFSVQPRTFDQSIRNARQNQIYHLEVGTIENKIESLQNLIARTKNNLHILLVPTREIDKYPQRFKNDVPVHGFELRRNQIHDFGFFQKLLIKFFKIRELC